MTRTSKKLSYQRTRKNFSLASTQETYSKVTVSCKANEKSMRSMKKERNSITVMNENILQCIESIPENSIKSQKMEKENVKLLNKQKFSQQSTMISNSQEDTDFLSNKEPNLKDKKRSQRYPIKNNVNSDIMNKDLDPESDKLKLKITYSSAPCELSGDSQKDRQINKKVRNVRSCVSEFLQPNNNLHIDSGTQKSKQIQNVIETKNLIQNMSNHIKNLTQNTNVVQKSKRITKVNKQSLQELKNTLKINKEVKMQIKVARKRLVANNGDQKHIDRIAQMRVVNPQKIHNLRTKINKIELTPNAEQTLQISRIQNKEGYPLAKTEVNEVTAQANVKAVPWLRDNFIQHSENLVDQRWTPDAIDDTVVDAFIEECSEQFLSYLQKLEDTKAESQKQPNKRRLKDLAKYNRGGRVESLTEIQNKICCIQKIKSLNTFDMIIKQSFTFKETIMSILHACQYSVDVARIMVQNYAEYILDELYKSISMLAVQRNLERTELAIIAAAKFHKMKLRKYNKNKVKTR